MPAGPAEAASAPLSLAIALRGNIGLLVLPVRRVLLPLRLFAMLAGWAAGLAWTAGAYPVPFRNRRPWRPGSRRLASAD